MHSGSMCFRGPPCRTHCYLPVTPVAFCCGDVGPAFGLCLPSSYQASLWLLDNCQESYGDTLSCEPRTRSTGWAPRNPCVPGTTPAVGTACRASETPSAGPGRGPSAACQTLNYGPQLLGQQSPSSKSFRPLNPCRLGSVGYRSVPSLGAIPAVFSPSHYFASSCQPRNYIARNCRYPRYRPSSCQPLSYVPRPWGALSCLPSTFPPLRFLRRGCRPLSRCC